MASDRGNLSRKMAAIVHADVTDSTALVQLNEALAHERINQAFTRFSQSIEHYGGTVHEIRGDALVAEFPRASDAVSAALAFQQSHHQALTEIDDEIAPMIRIGVSLGEVIFADGQVTGAGVVLAQRVEQLAEPGGLCITAAIHEALPQHMPFDQYDLGEQEVKGFEESVRVYRVGLKTGEAIPLPEKTKQPKASNVLGISAVVAIVLVIAGGVAFWFQPWQPEEEPASVERMAFPLPDKPSVAVLPFTNMSDDAQQEYFVDGMTEDLITDLSKLSGLFVIARNSVFTYKDKPVKVGQVAEELGVRYVLEGRVRRVANQVRINAQLIDATSGGHVWAERYDGTLSDIFSLQDQVTERIVEALQVELTGEETHSASGRWTDNPLAHDAFLQGWAHYKLGGSEDLARSIPHFEEALRLDLDYVQAHAALAWVYWDAYSKEWAYDLDMPSFRAEGLANQHLQKALETPNPLAHSLQSQMYISVGFLTEAVEEAKHAVGLDANNASAIAALAHVLVLAGEPGEGETAIRRAMRLDPYHPPSYLTVLGAAQFGAGKYTDAVGTLERAVNRNPEDELPRIYLAASLGSLGRIDHAEAVVEETNDLRGRRGLGGALSLEKADNDGISPFEGEINFKAFGTNENQQKLRDALSVIPALSWQYLLRYSYDYTLPGRIDREVIGATLITLERAKALYDIGVPFVDARNGADWRRVQIPGSINLPADWDEQGLVEPLYRLPHLRDALKKTDEFVVLWCTSKETFCSAGFEAAKAVAWGYENVYWLGAESLPEWIAAGYPVEKGD